MPETTEYFSLWATHFAQIYPVRIQIYALYDWFLNPSPVRAIDNSDKNQNKRSGKWKEDQIK